MTDVAPSGTSSTPASTSTAPVTASSAQPAQTSEPAQPAAVTTEPVTATAATPPAEPVAKTTAPATAPAPAFKLPEDLTLAPQAVEKFTAFLTSKSSADGKVSLSPQELVDLYADQARGAYQRWQESVATQNSTWESESKARFSPAQLAAAETGVGFLSSFEPAFRELSKGFRNNPAFVNAMRVVGERLSEDTFEIAGTPPTPARRAPKDILYPKRN